MSVKDDVCPTVANGAVRRVSAPGTTTGGRRRGEADRLPAMVPRAAPPAAAEPVEQVRRQRNWALALALLACLALLVFALLDRGSGGGGTRARSSALAGPAPTPFVPV